MSRRDRQEHLDRVSEKIKGVVRDEPVEYRESVEESLWTAFPVVPESAPKPNFEHYKRGIPTATYEFRNQNGLLCGYSCRFDGPDGKGVLPYSYCSKANGEQSWIWKALPTPRPLYNEHLITPGKPAFIIIVEGEKCAKALQQLVPPGIVVVAWWGGVNMVRNVKFNAIYGYKVALWPDHDLPGYQCMLDVAKILQKKCTVKIIKPPQDKPKGWDVADAIKEKWDYQTIMSYCKANLIDLCDYERFVADFANPTPINIDLNNLPFKFLGYDREIYYYHPSGTKQVKSLNPSGHTSNQLFTIAEKDFWEEYFPSKHGINLPGACNFLFQQSLHAGVYDPSRVRGCGTWLDNGRVVVHNGKHLDVDGAIVPVSQIQSHHLYELEIEKHINSAQPISLSESGQLLEITDMLCWDNPLHSRLLAGWIVVAPICGALTWRPHIQLTGGAGVGKTYVMENIIKPAIGDVAIYVTASTTEAGIRQALGANAFPVVFDEADPRNQHSRQKLNAVFDLMRQAASDSEAVLLKGTPSGAAIEFRIRSCFCLAGISVNMSDEADMGRITVLSLRENKSPQKAEHFKTLKTLVVKTLRPDWCSGLRSRTIQKIKVIMENISVFSEVAALRLGTRRAGDQIGALLGGAYSLTSDSPITEQQANDYMSTFDFDEHKRDDTERDEKQCLDAILQMGVKFMYDSKHIDQPVTNLIKVVVKSSGAVEWGEDAPVVPAKIAAEELLRYGIKVNMERGVLMVANTSRLIAKELSNSPWEKNWGRTLLRISGAVEFGPQRFLFGVQARSVGIPLSVLEQP